MNYDILDISYFISNYWNRKIYFEGYFEQTLSYLRDGRKNTPVFPPLKYIVSYSQARFSRCIFSRQTLDIMSEIPSAWKIYSVWIEACSLYVCLRLGVFFTHVWKGPKRNMKKQSLASVSMRYVTTQELKIGHDLFLSWCPVHCRSTTIILNLLYFPEIGTFLYK